MGYLNDKNVYLSGPIEFDQSIDWRTDPKKTLNSKFGLNVFDPFKDPKQNWLSALNKARSEKDHKTMAKIAKSFVRKDLGKIDRTDFVVAYVPYKVPTTGTCHEIINSNEAKKPTLLVSNCDDIAFIPVWYFGFIPIEFMFPNWNALYQYLDEVDRGLHIDNDRWWFIYESV